MTAVSWFPVKLTVVLSRKHINGVTFIGGVSTDHSGFGVGRILDVELIADRILALHEDRELPLIPGYEQYSYQIQEHQK